MAAKYSVGQKVKIKTACGQQSSPRDSAIDAYAGQIGEVSSFYWISPHNSKIFYIYTVRVGKSYQEIALHEDELEAYLE